MRFGACFLFSSFKPVGLAFGNRYSNRTGTLAGVIVFVVVNTAYGLMPFVDNFMHLGGALMGFLVGNLFLIRPHSFRCWQSSAVYDQDDMPAKRTNAIILDFVWLLSFGVLVAALIMGLYGLFSGMVFSQLSTPRKLMSYLR